MPQDLRILGMEAIQVTQTLDNNVPLVKGKTTLIRIYPDALGGPVAPVGWRLEIYRDGALLGSFSGQIAAVRLANIEQARDSENAGAQVRLPEDWQTGTLQAIFTIDPNNTIAEINESNNTRSETFSFADRRPLRVLYQLIHLVIPAQGIDASPDQTKAPGQGAWVDEYFPHPNLDYHLLPNPLEWNDSLKNVADPQLTVLEKRLKNALKDSLNVYNQNPPNGKPYDQIFGIYPGNGGEYLSYCGSEGSWVVTPAQAGFCSINPEFMAHEIGHNYGARHPGLGAESCNADDPGTDWPYATAAIQQPARDFLNARVVPRTTKDVMSYCPVTFFSPHTYTKLYLNLPATQTAGPESAMPLADQEYLRISGLVFKTGSVEFDPVFHFTSASPQQNPLPGIAYCLELRSDANALLDQVCFELAFTDEDTGAPVEVDSFMVNLPLAVGTAKVVLTYQGGALGQVAASAHAPQVTLVTPNGGGAAGNPLLVQWTASDSDSDSLTFRLLLSSDNGISWIPAAMNLQGVTSYSLDTSLMPGTSQALIRVEASDGFHMAADDFNATFTIAQKWPIAQITIPSDGATIPPDAALAGAAYDPEDGPLPGATLNWTSSRDGDLGSGANLNDLGLSEGQHVLTLTAIDLSGKSSNVSITVNVVAPRLVFLPAVNRP